MNTTTALFASLFLWLAGLSAFTGYIGYVSLRNSAETVITILNTTNDKLNTTTDKVNTLFTTLALVQADVNILNTTTNNTLQSTTITYDNSDLNIWIEATGSTVYKAYLYLNDSADVNITDVLPNNTTDACNCVGYSYYRVRNLSPISPDQVFVSSDLSFYCQYTTTSGNSACVSIGNPCRQLIVIIPYPFGLSTTVKINRSYGSVCI